jgi:hypothetical protein
MKKALITISMVLFYLSGFSQECTKENVSRIPGKWKAGMPGASVHTAADNLKEKTLALDIIKTIRTNLTWSPVGGDITYGVVYGIRDDDYRPLPLIKACNRYAADIMYQHYFCSEGRINLEDFAIIVTATINDIPFQFPETFFKSRKDKLGYDTDTDPDTDKYTSIAKLPKTKDGMFEFTEPDQFGSGGGQDMVYRYRVLTKPGQMPYSVMSKKEYYEKSKIKHYQNIAEHEKRKIKAAESDKIAGNTRGVESEDRSIAYEQGQINKIDEQLNSRTAAELAAPAFNGEESGEYYEANTKQSTHRYIIKPNLAYYNFKLPKTSPQVITLCFRYRQSTDKYGDITYADEVFYKELERIKILDLLTVKLQPLIEQ